VRRPLQQKVPTKFDDLPQAPQDGDGRGVEVSPGHWIEGEPDGKTFLVRKAGKNGSKVAPTRDSILAHLKAQIVSGRLSPGSRLPTRRELERQFRSTLVTTQRAFEKLQEEGFVSAHGKAGTFVADHPPHLFHYALVFPRHPSSNHDRWPRFWEALCYEAVAVERSQPRKVEMFYDVDPHVDGQNHRRLVEMVRAQRLAGLIFPHYPAELTKSRLLVEPGVGRVGFMQTAEINDVAAISFDYYSFIEKAIEHLRSRGRKRIALLGLPEWPNEYQLAFARGLAARGMATREYWMQAIARSAHPSAGRVVHLLMNPAQTERPDGLVVMDDNLLEHATMGLIAAGVRVPDDMDVVAHTNFPWPTPSAVPVKRLGFDVRRILAVSLDLIDRQRRNEQPAHLTTVRATFEDEPPIIVS
jgi:hypothetical protein